MHKFSYDFIKSQVLTANLFSISNVIINLKERTSTKKMTKSNLFKKLETIAIKDSVEASNAIEGIHTTEKRIEEIVENNSKPLTHDEEEIAGYRDAIIFVKENYKYLSFNEETIKKLHSMLFSRHAGSHKGGEYKKEDNIIAERNKNGTIKKLIFKTVPAKNVEKQMNEFMLAYQVARDDYAIPSLLLIPCVIVDFLAIHPFQDGNGRLSRLLTLLLLFKEEIDIGRYVSFEKMINNYKFDYYDALQSSQVGWHENKCEYQPFIVFTFQIIYECYKKMNERFLILSKDKMSKKEIIKATLKQSLVPISKEEIHTLFPDISITTIEAELAKLQKTNEITKIGTFKNAKYIFNIKKTNS
ncbi:MAG: Fic family protein [Bacilli bacterium]|nr:Fic family protein [Bacilli bacterium]